VRVGLIRRALLALGTTTPPATLLRRSFAVIAARAAGGAAGRDAASVLTVEADAPFDEKKPGTTTG